MQEYYLEIDREIDHETLQSAQILQQSYPTHENSHTFRGDLQEKFKIPTNVSELFFV
jgi:hypothetical protein